MEALLREVSEELLKEHQQKYLEESQHKNEIPGDIAAKMYESIPLRITEGFPIVILGKKKKKQNNKIQKSLKQVLKITGRKPTAIPEANPEGILLHKSPASIPREIPGGISGKKNQIVAEKNRVTTL